MPVPTEEGAGWGVCSVSICIWKQNQFLIKREFWGFGDMYVLLFVFFTIGVTRKGSLW